MFVGICHVLKFSSSREKKLGLGGGEEIVGHQIFSKWILLFPIFPFFPVGKKDRKRREKGREGGRNEN